MTRFIPIGLAVGVLCAAAAAQAPQSPQPQSQPGTAAQIGEKIDRGLSQIGAELSQGWADIRKSVEKMGVQSRVYGRLHWDKALQDATLEIEIRDGQVVTLKGNVSSLEAKGKAVQLARDTVGVNNVTDELTVGRNSSR
jgi:osmotically-inducible protein OsmY